MKTELIRLDKALADQGTVTRSQARELITKGLVTVNGLTLRDAAAKLCRETDTVVVNGKPLALQKHCYLLLNKPAGVVSATEDARDRTVLELVPPALWRKGLFPAGRLDKDTTGMLILTDDGDFAHRILAPKSHVDKTYLATLDKPVTAEMKAAFDGGIQLKDEKKCMPAALSILDTCTAKVVIHEGMYHQIKRMFGCFGAKVLSLHRIAIGSLALEATLAPGDCRPLTADELSKIEEKSS